MELVLCRASFSHVYVQTNGSQKWMRNDALEGCAAKTIDLGLCLTAKTKPMAHRVLIAKRLTKSESQPKKDTVVNGVAAISEPSTATVVHVVLATNLTELSPQKIMAIYATRMQIEETFRDTKVSALAGLFDMPEPAMHSATPSCSYSLASLEWSSPLSVSRPR